MATKKGLEIIMVWDGRALVPYAPVDLEAMQTVKIGTPVRVDVERFRSLSRHRYYWGILGRVVENTPFATKESLHKFLLSCCGVVEPFVTPEGEFVLIPSSTAFDEMKTEDVFKPYFDAAMLVLTTQICPGLDLDALFAEGRAYTKYEEVA
ncbi:hypothetical protein PUR29_34715 [Methylobacterium ajmalii]|uniref:Uncharacterized protein n=1 Tax=Methylobacterium ajmalii TaxID=2738439 RepID=A0ABV0A667_9HYPH